MTAGRKVATLLMAVGTVHIACAAVHKQNLLDASTAIVDPEPGHVLESGWGGSIRKTPPPIPIRVRLLKTDRKQYRRMEKVLDDVSLENVSNGPVVIPWSPKPIKRRDRPASGYRYAIFEFELTQSAISGYVADFFVLYGSPAVSGSLKTLAPGQRVVIRMPAVLTGSGQQDAANPILNPSVRVQAKVGVLVYAPDDPRFGSMNEQFSENTQPVQIVPTIPAVAAPAPIQQPPVILGASPQPASAGDVIRLEGLRVGADRFGRDKGPLPRIVFSKDSTSISAKLNGGSRFDNRPDGPQAVAVVVPAGIEAGNWNVVVELDGLEAAPFPVSIAEWIPPHIDRLYPERVNPGGAVTVWGAHFRTNDGIEMTDALGASHTFGSGTFGDSVAFLVSTDAPEGEASVRIRASRNGATVYSRALSFLVTFAPLPLDLSGSTARSVGAGQWLDFEGTTLDGPIHWSDRTEVEFRQRSEVVVTQTARPTALRVQVPAIMLPGPITLRGRTWHEGAVSEWSAPAAFLVAGRAVAPTIRGVVVGPGQQYVSLIGRATPQRVEAADGDHVVLNGFFPTSDTTRIPIVLERRGRSVRVTTKRLDAYNVDLLVPEGLSGGPWTITVGATEGMPPLSLPISMYVHNPTSGRRSN